MITLGLSFPKEGSVVTIVIVHYRYRMQKETYCPQDADNLTRLSTCFLSCLNFLPVQLLHLPPYQWYPAGNSLGQQNTYCSSPWHGPFKLCHEKILM